MGIKSKTNESHSRLDGLELTDSTPSVGCCSGVNILEPISAELPILPTVVNTVGGMMEGSNKGGGSGRCLTLRFTDKVATKEPTLRYIALCNPFLVLTSP